MDYNAREQGDGALYHPYHAKEISLSFDGIFNNAGWM